MATLSDTLRRNALHQSKQLVRGEGGVLSEETDETLQDLAGQAGLPAPPLTPGGAAAIGASPDQQKMVGTPQQKQAALQLSSVPVEQSLQGALRRQQVRSEATAEEAAAMEKSEDLRNLGSLGDRVHGFIEAQRQKLTAAAPVTDSVQVAGQVTTAQGQTIDSSSLVPLLRQLRSNPRDMDTMLRVNQALGYDANRQLSPEEIQRLYESTTDSIARGAVGNIDNDLTVSDLMQRGDFGYTPDQLSQLLGVPADQLQAMSVGQLRSEIQRVADEEFSTVQKLEQQAQSGQLGAAERALARAGAREASRVGTRSSEADVAALEQQIASADQVTFGGRTFKVDDLLRDETISGLISEYLSAAPGSELRLQVERTEPQLVEFIQKNQALFEDASEHLGAGATEFASIQEHNRQLARSLPENIARLVLPEIGSLQTGRIDVSNRPLVQWAQANPQAAQALQGVSDEDARALTGLSVQELDRLEIGSPTGKWAQYVEDRNRVQDLRNRINQVRGDKNAIVQLAFGGQYPGSYDRLALDYKAQQKAALLGLPNTLDEWKKLDPDGDGEIQGADHFLEQLSADLNYSLDDALAGRRADVSPLEVPSDNTDRWSDEEKLVYKKLGNAALDGRLDAEELLQSRLNVDELMDLNLRGGDAIGTRSLSEAVAQRAFEEVQEKYDLETMEGINQAYEEMNSLRDSLKEKLKDTGGASLAITTFREPLTTLSDMLDLARQGQIERANQFRREALEKFAKESKASGSRIMRR